MTAATFSPRSCGHDIAPENFGELKKSDDIANDPIALQQRMAQDGYLYLPNFLDRNRVFDARAFVTRRLTNEGALDLDYPEMDAVCAPGKDLVYRPDLAEGNAPLKDVLYSGAMIEFFEGLLGGDVRHFDYTWFRAMGPGHGTKPHCDIVYMGRGTRNLFTAWVPIGDVSYEIGGLMILENSHLQSDKLRTYLERDVDTYCSNYADGDEIATGKKMWHWPGWLSNNPATLCEKLGGRWLSAEYRAGDLLVFSMATVHASLDNQSNRIRFSSDSRYQLASDPVDERWIGENPIAHSLAGKRGRIC